MVVWAGIFRSLEQVAWFVGFDDLNFIFQRAGMEVSMRQIVLCSSIGKIGLCFLALVLLFSSEFAGLRRSRAAIKDNDKEAKKKQ